MLQMIPVKEYRKGIRNVPSGIVTCYRGDFHMSNLTKYKWFFRLLATREGRRILLIPTVILLALSLFTIYQMELNPKPERVEMQDGSGDIKLTKRSALIAFKLPQEVGEVRDIVGEDMKVTSYDVFCDKDNNIKSAMVNVKADEKEAKEIIDSYQKKYGLTQVASAWNGDAGGFDISIRYDRKDQRIDIDLKKK